MYVCMYVSLLCNFILATISKEKKKMFENGRTYLKNSGSILLKAFQVCLTILGHFLLKG